MAFNEKIMRKLKDETKTNDAAFEFVSKVFAIESTEPLFYDKEYDQALKSSMDKVKEVSE